MTLTTDLKSLSNEEKADILDAAADRLKGGRWQQGDIGCTKTADKPVCLAGAIEATLGNRFGDLALDHYAYLTQECRVHPDVARRLVRDDDEDDEKFFFKRPVVVLEDELLETVGKVIGPSEHERDYAHRYGLPEPATADAIDWNDADGRTSRQVISALRRTAKALRNGTVS